MSTVPGERVVRVVREILATETGHWCNTCSAPSGIRMWVTFRLGEKMHMQDAYGCGDCHSRDITVADDPTFRGGQGL